MAKRVRSRSSVPKRKRTMDSPYAESIRGYALPADSSSHGNSDPRYQDVAGRLHDRGQPHRRGAAGTPAAERRRPAASRCAPPADPRARVLVGRLAVGRVATLLAGTPRRLRLTRGRAALRPPVPSRPRSHVGARKDTTAMTTPTITLTGIQPTGELHLGNYAGAIRPLAELAAEPARETYVFVADLHALNGRARPGAAARPRRGRSPPRCSPAASTTTACTSTGSRACPAVAQLSRAAGERHQQGDAEPRARLQGGSSPPTPPPDATPTTASTWALLHLPGADGRRHPRRATPTRCRSAPTRPSTWRSRVDVAQRVQRSIYGDRRRCRSRGRSTRRPRRAARPRRPQDEQELRQHHPAVRAARAAGQAHPPRRHRQPPPAGSQGPGHLHARRAARHVRRPGGRPGRSAAATGPAGIGYGEVKALLADAAARRRWRRCATATRRCWPTRARLDAALAAGERHANGRAAETLAR